MKKGLKICVIFIILSLFTTTISISYILFNNYKNNKFEEIIMIETTSKSDKEIDIIEEIESKHIMEVIDGVTYIDNVLIVNKTYSLPKDFLPKNTYTSPMGITKTCNTCIDNDAYNAFNKMKSDATSLGLNIWIQSGYRPYSSQETIYNNYVLKDGKTKADTYSARPGHSEHQSGLCFDLNTIEDSFQYTNEGKWVNNNAYLYGFIIRFPKGKENYTGYKYESWHLRYVGKELAKELFNNGDWISLEEYFDITSEYEN